MENIEFVQEEGATELMTGIISSQHWVPRVLGVRERTEKTVPHALSEKWKLLAPQKSQGGKTGQHEAWNHVAKIVRAMEFRENREVQGASVKRGQALDLKDWCVEVEKRGEEFLERPETNGAGHKGEKLPSAKPRGWTVGALSLGATFRFCKKND